MTALTWDDVGERLFETGVDRGVLYMLDGRVVPWNGFTGVEENTANESESFYLDGVKILERHVPGDYSATLKALTYPTEFEEVLGITSEQVGLNYHSQKPQPFHLSYRTKIGNDVEGTEYGYRLHIIYNLMAIPNSQAFSSVGDVVQPTEFSWQLSSVPLDTSLLGIRPTSHISIDSTKSADRARDLEDVLYGTSTTNPTLPDLNALVALFSTFESLIIIDKGNGLWTASDPYNDYITMTNSTTFSIDGANVEYLDADTYTISSTNPDQ